MARRTKEDACATRNSLLDAAEQVFYAQGVARASLNEIAQSAGATRGAVYWHFKDKLDLFYSMLDRATLPLEQAAYGDGVDGEGPEGVARVRHVMASVFLVLERDPDTRRVFEILLHKVEYVGELLAVQERNVQAMEEFSRKLELALISAQKSQKMEHSVDVHEAALALRCLFDGVIRGWFLSRGSFDLAGVGMRAVDAYLRGLGFVWKS